MINPLTGEITFDDTPTVVGPRFTRAAFHLSDLAARSEMTESREPWYKFSAPWYRCWVRDCRSVLPFGVELMYHGEALREVCLMHMSADYGTSFAEYTPDRVSLRQQRHKEWLANVCHLTPGRLSWGSVASYHNDNDMRTAILVTYFFPVGA
jgi:hypothetical protein